MNSGHFKWESVPATSPRRGIVQQAVADDHVMLVMNTLEPGLEPRPHSHDFDQVVLIIEGECLYHVGDHVHQVAAGSILFVPAGTQHYAENNGRQTVKNLDLFVPPRADYSHLIAWMTDRGPASELQSDSPPFT